jgi:hypothetical protein
LQFIGGGIIVFVAAIETARGLSHGETTMAKSRKGLDQRHRDKSERIERKHGITKVAALHKEYGALARQGCFVQGRVPRGLR